MKLRADCYCRSQLFALDALRLPSDPWNVAAQYFATNLELTAHRLEITHLASDPAVFLDLDYAVVAKWTPAPITTPASAVPAATSTAAASSKYISASLSLFALR